MAAAAAIAPVLAILGNFSQDPLPAVFVAVGGLVVLKFALGVSGRYPTLISMLPHSNGSDIHLISRNCILCPSICPLPRQRRFLAHSTGTNFVPL